MGSADAAVSGGFKDAGYTLIAQDDCWATRNATTGALQGDAVRFPHVSELGAYMHARGLTFGMYTAEG